MREEGNCMECSYLRRRSATVWPALPTTLLGSSKRLAVLLFFLSLLACASKWSGSVGAVLGKNNHDGRLYVRDAPSDMGAAKAGVQPGDEVTAIDGQAVLTLSSDDIHKALAGAVGSKVKLTVVRDGQTLSFEIERGPLRGE
jgi:S1-C subfamily serine protease